MEGRCTSRCTTPAVFLLLRFRLCRRPRWFQPSWPNSFHLGQPQSWPVPGLPSVSVTLPESASRILLFSTRPVIFVQHGIPDSLRATELSRPTGFFQTDIIWKKRLVGNPLPEKVAKFRDQFSRAVFADTESVKSPRFSFRFSTAGFLVVSTSLHRRRGQAVAPSSMGFNLLNSVSRVPGLSS